MRDPLDELENFTTPGPTMNPLPASEVRRRGTRMRRRNNALAAIGGVTAVAIIATPLALAATNDRTDTTPPVTNPSPAVRWVQEIPAGFPLTTGLPETNGGDGSPVQVEEGFDQQITALCPGAVWDAAGSSDAAQATYTDVSEGGSQRGVAVYPDESQATRTMEALSAQVAACAAQTDGQTQRWVTVLTSELGDDSLVYANHYTDGGDIDVVQLVQVGNAIMQATAYSTGAPAEDTAALVQEKSASVIDAMCVFAADPC